MSQSEQITVTLPPELAAAVKTAVDAGRYGSAEEVVREALQDWAEAEDNCGYTTDELRALIQEGLDDETEIPAEEVFADLRARFAIKS